MHGQNMDLYEHKETSLPFKSSIICCCTFNVGLFNRCSSGIFNLSFFVEKNRNCFSTFLFAGSRFSFIEITALFSCSYNIFKFESNDKLIF